MPVADGQTIETVADEMLLLVGAIRTGVTATIHGTRLEIPLGVQFTREKLIKLYNEDQQKKKESNGGAALVPRYHSPQAIIDTHQQKMDALMQNLSHSSFHQLDVIIDWLSAVFKNQLAEVNYNADDVVAALETRGYDDFERQGAPRLNIQDGSEFGTNIVGRAISDLKRYGRLMNSIEGFCHHWKKRYGGQGLKKTVGKGGFRYL